MRADRRSTDRISRGPLEIVLYDCQTAGRFITPLSCVMAGLDPAIHVFVARTKSKTWITGTSPVMTSIDASLHSHGAIAPEALSLPSRKRAPRRIVLLEFPALEACESLYHGDTYRGGRRLGKQGLRVYLPMKPFSRTHEIMPKHSRA
jgi:hypothetical protein